MTLLSVAAMSRRLFSSTCTCRAAKVRGPPAKTLIAQFQDHQIERENQRLKRQATPAVKSADGYEASDLTQYESNLSTIGQIYSPDDLSFEAKRPMQQSARRARIKDKFEKYQISPIDEYTSHDMMSEFVSDLGRIMKREQTGLSAKNQRKLGKAVRRARALSLLPSTAKHPESVRIDGQRGLLNNRGSVARFNNPLGNYMPRRVES